MPNFDVDNIRKDFPILTTKMNGKELVYLDSAATSQKPIQVINKITDYYKTYNANIHRGIYQISEEATEAYIESKKKAAKFINADSYREIIYTKNATESINLVALSWAEQNIRAGDHILITEMEHHSNIVPWQMLAKRKAAILDYITIDTSTAALDAGSIEKQLDKNPKLLAITHTSNVLGTINDIHSISKQAHKRGAYVLVDAAQSVPHIPVDIKALNADFLAFSSHKMLGPSGLGILYAKGHILEQMPPVMGGGDMILTVDKERSTWNEIPWKFEAGTPNIEGAIGFGEAMDYLQRIGMENIKQHETKLTEYALGRIEEIKDVKTFGPSTAGTKNRGGIISFAIKGVHPHDIATVFNNEAIAIRAGHHCAMPLVTAILKLPAVSRISFYLYNKMSEIDYAMDAIKKTKDIFHIY